MSNTSRSSMGAPFASVSPSTCLFGSCGKAECQKTEGILDCVSIQFIHFRVSMVTTAVNSREAILNRPGIMYLHKYKCSYKTSVLIWKLNTLIGSVEIN